MLKEKNTVHSILLSDFSLDVLYKWCYILFHVIISQLSIFLLRYVFTYMGRGGIHVPHHMRGWQRKPCGSLCSPSPSGIYNWVINLSIKLPYSLSCWFPFVYFQNSSFSLFFFRHSHAFVRNDQRDPMHLLFSVSWW